MKHRHFSFAPLVIIPGGIIVILAVAAGHFYQETKKYQEQNRALIIQNDSIISVNIELKNAIRFISMAKKSTAVSFKTPN